jgi:hypothetical protein
LVVSFEPAEDVLAGVADEFVAVSIDIGPYNVLDPG